MKNLPLEKRVCTLDQARELAELLGDDAPESLWMWAYYKETGRWKVIEADYFQRRYFQELYRLGTYPAYTGDEFDSLLPWRLPHPEEKFRDEHWIYLKTRAVTSRLRRVYYADMGGEVYHEYAGGVFGKADLAIELLEKGHMKKEDFRYA